jgi:outer membrane protein assembly factor BamB
METKRTYFHRRPDGVTIVASSDESASPHNPAPTRVTYLQVFDAAGQATATRDALNAPLYVAMHENFPVLARRGAVDFLDLSLNTQRRLEADITPHGLSLDETGRSYLLCAVQNRQQLWILTPTGEYSATSLPDGVAAFHRPPVVGYDHRIYLLALDRILCLSASGQIEWQYQAPGRVAGAAVSTNGQLLASIGDAVVALNPGGEDRTLCRVAGEQLMGSPILGSAGELYALTGRRLHCFVTG